MRFPPDDVLLDFDEERLASFDGERAKETLDSDLGDLYRNHLVAAHWVQTWIEGLVSRPRSTRDEDSDFVKALREIAAHLRQGDLIPGGTLHDDTLRQLEQR